MKKVFLKSLIVIIILVILFVLYFIIDLMIYLNAQHKNYSQKKFCAQSKFTTIKIDRKLDFEDENDCYNKMYSLIIPHLLISKVELKQNKQLKYYLIDGESTYYVPDFVTTDADAMISYGIGSSCRFEDNYAKFFNKPVFSFDCGVKNKNICKVSNFEQECIVPATEPHHRLCEEGECVHVFGEKIKQLNLQDKKLYLKINIGQYADDILEDVLKYADNIMAISLVIELRNPQNIINKPQILKEIEKKFVLTTRINIKDSLNDVNSKYVQEKDYTEGILAHRVSLTYINKSLLKNYYLLFNQSNKMDYDDLIFLGGQKTDYNIYSNIHPIVVLTKKLKNKYGIGYE